MLNRSAAPGSASARPGSRRDAPRTRPRQRPPQRSGGLTTRAAVLALVVCMLSLSLAYPLREYLAQRHDIAALETRVAQQRADVAAAQTAIARWRDPAYVRAQAKERLHMVDPGERQYGVVDGTSAGGSDPASPAPVPAPGNTQPETEAWFGTLLGSLQDADRSGSAASASAR